ncbi:MAG: ribonuclease PH, partial [Gemmatimonadaceae bacterium]|nr:ribonuclease PH [Gemmatimonadaceae bacterium]
MPAPEVSARVGRALDALRPLTLERQASPYAEGSCLITCGNTRVLCTASVEDGVPSWRRGRGEGWMTAEYAMLPRATHTRT